MRRITIPARWRDRASTLLGVTGILVLGAGSAVAVYDHHETLYQVTGLAPRPTLTVTAQVTPPQAPAWSQDKRAEVLVTGAQILEGGIHKTQDMIDLARADCLGTLPDPRQCASITYTVEKIKTSTPVYGIAVPTITNDKINPSRVVLDPMLLNEDSDLIREVIHHENLHLAQFATAGTVERYDALKKAAAQRWPDAEGTLATPDEGIERLTDCQVYTDMHNQPSVDHPGTAIDQPYQGYLHHTLAAHHMTTDQVCSDWRQTVLEPALGVSTKHKYVPVQSMSADLGEQ